ncbi:hypothetical protein ACVMIH_002521 [Bradyrhizobium sp. USDA 4503]
MLVLKVRPNPLDNALRICSERYALSRDFPRMRVRESDRNLLLLGTFTLLSVAAAGLVALLDPAPAPANPALRPPANHASASDQGLAQTRVRIVGTPFVPNTNPRQR